MANGLLSSIPDVSGLVNAGDGLEGNIQTLLNTFASLESDEGDSPLAGVITAFTDLDDVLDIDVGPLAEQLPNSLQSLRNALPANTLNYVESIDDTFNSVIGLLQQTGLTQQIPDGSSLQDTALAVITDALALFDTRIAELTGNLIDTEALDALQAVFVALQQFSDDFPAHQADFLPFLTNNLMGLAPDLLDAPLAHFETAVAVLAPLQETALAATIAPVELSLLTAFAAINLTIDTLDPADATAYADIQLRLDDIENASTLMVTALDGLYQEMEGLIAGHAWSSIFSVYTTLLEALAIDDVFTMDDVIDIITEMLEDLLARLLMAFDAEELHERITALNQSIRETVMSSPLGQILPTLEGFLNEIREAIEGIPTEDIQAAVEGLIAEVAGQLDALNLGQIQDQINQAFEDVNTFIDDNIDEALRTEVQNALAAIATEVGNLPITALLTDLTNALGQLQTVIDDLENAVQGELDSLENLLSGLDDLSFQPISEAVIAEIDALREQLAAINPNALSDVEKLAIAGALAVLEAIDLQTNVVNGLKDGYHAAEGEINVLLDQLTAALERLRDRFLVFSPDAILQPVTALLDEAEGFIDQLNGRALLGFLYDQLEALEALLAQISPGQLLDPLQGPYDALMVEVNRLDPAVWVAPLNTLYAEIDRLISFVDITPLLNELDQRQRTLFNDIQTTILTALDDLNLPEPLNSFFTALRPLFELITEAVFGDPDTELMQLSLEIESQIDFNTLFAPLDDVFLQLVDLLESVPASDLTDAMNTIRQTLGVGLAVLDPRALIERLRNGHSQLTELAPTNVLGVSLRLPALQLSFEAQATGAPPERAADVLAVSARFEAVFSVVTPEASGGQMQQLIQAHEAVRQALRLRINELDHADASANYAQVRRNVDRLIPDFLRQAEPLTHDDILAGISAMRPSTKAMKIEQAVERLLQQIRPMEETLEPGINDFFTVLRDIVGLINPLAIRDEVEAIYEAIRDKVRIIDPDDLAEAINTVLDPLTAPLDALNPTAIKAQIDAAFNNALDALTGTVREALDGIVGIIDVELRAIRDAVKLLIGQIKATLEVALQSIEAVLGRLEDLVFVEVLGRLRQVIENLGVSFDTELDRVVDAFDAMLAAIPLDTGASVSI